MLGRPRIRPGFVVSALWLVVALLPAGCGEENGGPPPEGPPVVRDAAVDRAVDDARDVGSETESEGGRDSSVDAPTDRADLDATNDRIDISHEPETGVSDGAPEDAVGDPDGADDASDGEAGFDVPVFDGGPVTGPGCGGCFADELLSTGRCFTNTSCGSPHHAVMTRVNGECRIHVCHPGWADCDGRPETGCEADLGRPENCTRCGNMCPAGQVCASTGCVTTCAPPTIDCSGACVDVSSSPEHCTACFMACPVPQWNRATCAAGVCGSEVVCPPGASPCGKGCSLLAEDPANCGACGRACSWPLGGSVSCRGGTCIPHCPAGFVFCNDACVDVKADPAHCGRCGNVCATGGCAAGTCDPSWSPVVATGTAPTVLAIDETSLYWLEGAAGTVMKAPKSGGTPVTLATGQTSPFDLVLDATHVYWSNRTGNAIMRTAKAGGGSPELVVSAREPMHLAVDGVFVYFEQPPPVADAGTDAAAVDHAPPPVVRKVRIGTSVAEPFWEFPNGDTDSVLGKMLVDATNVYWSGRRFSTPGNYFTFLIDKGLGATLRSFPGNWGELTMDEANLYMTTGSGAANTPVTIAAIDKINGKGGAIVAYEFRAGAAYTGGGNMVAGDTYLYRTSPGDYAGVHKVLKCGLQNLPVNLTGADAWSSLVTDSVYVYGIFGAQIRRVHR